MQLNDPYVEKSSIGCYVYHNGRLLDVMVITGQSHKDPSGRSNELEQTLELTFNDKSQIIQIIVKQLGHGERKYGKFRAGLKVWFLSLLMIYV